ncbi:Zn-dependent hydrolase [Alteromonas sp.]|uniref:dipeptidyl-peptidase 3 family protein n=1 Tax=Alteromonas sp. TaxID=232 RepID=UPI000B75215B|nr:Zn-dependent hydrolase [Alteromonas sp.]MAI37848.1 Zn-dependent hydrolase [Alteromonas sp.]OUX87368.1 MAG: Zn-dependent hydrolase [Alteromonas sp. TMED35]|tara:strand:- start:102 stop:1802 length:1701 start_codon:yes stop_codon:yes gene_type:complete
MKKIIRTGLSPVAAALAGVFLLGACSQPKDTNSANTALEDTADTKQTLLVDESRLAIYHPVDLTANLDHLSDNQHKMLSLLIDASKIMDELFWQQAFFGSKASFLSGIESEEVRHFASINYGPWDRLNGDTPFISGFDAKYAGAQFYPHDMEKAEFATAEFADKQGLYSMVKRDEAGNLYSEPYSIAFKSDLMEASDLLLEAAELAEDESFKAYLTLRADALLTDDYLASDMAWMDMKTNPIELVIGPIESYEDQLFGYRAAFEAYVLVKDLSWSEKLAKYAAFLPELQQGLPVAKAYKAEVPGSDADLNAYDVIYYAGHSNAGSKTIAINLPNDERVQLEKGTRRLQLKNAMQAKFDNILVPIADTLIVPEQRQHITFDAFFANTMFHEVAHGLGIKNTLDGSSTVRQALKEHASALEEGKADILGLYMVQSLLEKEEITEGSLEDYYVTFMAGIFRSVRFGASSAHGKANMIRFNFFAQQGAFEKTEDGLYRVNMQKMGAAVEALSELILTLQGDGDYDGVAELVETMGVIKPQLNSDLARLSDANIPVDIHFNQGKKVLGLPE